VTSSGEESRLAAIRERLGRHGITAPAGSAAPVTVGIGDDAAVLAPSAGATVLSVDAAVEGVHFRRDWASWRQLGRRAVSAAVSDLAAMGARPRAALFALALPRDLDDEALLAMIDGAADAGDEQAMPIVGGNLAAASEVSITTTVVGEIPAGSQPMRRSGARAGDGIYLTGTAGGAALGLALLLAGRTDDQSLDPRERKFVERWRHPVPAVMIGLRVRGIATAAIDVSDGLLADLGHLCAESKVGATVYADTVPRLEDFESVAKTVERDPWSLALAGGEDYELLFTAPASTTVSELATRIGEVTERAGAVDVLDGSGRRIEIAEKGYEHF
jgi:thiamine-monophosphate kinase